MIIVCKNSLKSHVNGQSTPGFFKKNRGSNNLESPSSETLAVPYIVSGSVRVKRHLEPGFIKQSI